eukprot:5513901-Amphidinium_carterae.1
MGHGLCGACFSGSIDYMTSMQLVARQPPRLLLTSDGLSTAELMKAFTQLLLDRCPTGLAK